MPGKHFCLLVAIACIAVLSCSKSSPTTNTPPRQDTTPSPPLSYSLAYSDTVFFVQENNDNNVAKPVKDSAGEYWGFPEGIEINSVTGAIDINKSEAGLRYNIFFLPRGSSDTFNTTVLISGINYLDRIYNLSANDSIAIPVYNADLTREVPVRPGTTFDEDGGCKRENVLIDVERGTINLAESIRRGLFGRSPRNGDAKEVEMLYRINDESGKALNKLKVKFYYFSTAAEISEDLVQLLKDREGTVFRTTGDPLPGARIMKTAKPRPPCLFIVGRTTR